MRVLAALDDSELADEVVEALAPWLAAAGAEARLMMVWDSRQVHPDTPTHPPDLVVSDPVVTSDSWARAPVDYVEDRTERRGQMIQRMRNERISSLRSLGERHLRGSFDVEIEGSEDVPQAILEAAEDYGADMIAIGTHGRTGLRRVLGGSVAEEVIRQARIPVFVVHQGSVVHPGAHYLVVAHDTARSVELREHLTAISERDSRASFTLLIPATHSSGLLGESDDDMGSAESSAAETRAVLRDAGINLADAKVGDPTPLLAIEDELHAHPETYDTVILCTFPPGMSRWVRMDTAHQVERRLDIPVEHVIAYRAPDNPVARDEYCQRLRHAAETARSQLARIEALSEGDVGIALPAREHRLNDELAAIERALYESGCG
jgi:nucleotide-binding universal stress UspA family protein